MLAFVPVASAMTVVLRDRPQCGLFKQRRECAFFNFNKVLKQHSYHIPGSSSVYTVKVITLSYVINKCEN